MQKSGGIQWTIAHAERLVTASVVGRVTRSGFEAYVAALKASGAGPYRKLFSVVGSHGGIRPSDLQGFGSVVNRYGEGEPVGPVAIVVDTQLDEALAQWFAANTSLDRPLRVFRTVRDARAWLDEHATVPSPSGHGGTVESDPRRAD